MEPEGGEGTLSETPGFDRGRGGSNGTGAVRTSGTGSRLLDRPPLQPDWLMITQPGRTGTVHRDYAPSSDRGARPDF